MKELSLISKPGLFAGGVVADVPGHNGVKWPSLRFTAIWSCQSAFVYCRDTLHTKREPAPQKQFHSGRTLCFAGALLSLCRWSASVPDDVCFFGCWSANFPTRCSALLLERECRASRLPEPGALWKKQHGFGVPWDVACPRRCRSLCQDEDSGTHESIRPSTDRFGSSKLS